MQFLATTMLLVLLFVQGAALAAPSRIGAQLHLSTNGNPEQSYLRHARAFVEGLGADYVFLCAQGLPDADRDRVVQYLAEKQVYFLVQEQYLPESRYYDTDDYARFKKLGGGYFLGLHWGELDSSGLKPEDYLPAGGPSEPTRDAVYQALEGRVRKIADDYHALGVPFAHSSATLSHGLFANAGVDMLCSEIGENAPHVAMMIASNRGAARAYGKPWMIDFSTWWSPRGNVGKEVSPREGHTPWCMFSSLLLSAMGGADYAQLEVDWAAYDTALLPGPPEQPLPPLLPWGQALKTLIEVNEAVGDPGEAETPFGILLAPQSGWPGVGWRVGDVRATGLFDGIRHQFMQTRDADLSFKILDILFPGFERCGWDPEYPGFLSESPLGPVDFLLDNFPLEALQRYRVLIALGYHLETPELLEKLRDYVAQGGILVCGDTLFLDASERLAPDGREASLIGCTLKKEEEALLQLDAPRSSLDAMDGLAEAASRQEWQTHWLHPVEMAGGKVVARLGDAPYLIENRIGRGRVFFVTALNMAGSSATRRGAEPFLYANILGAFLHTLAAHLGDGVRLAPWTSLEHVFSHAGDGSATLLVMNHGDMPYLREAALPNIRNFTSARVIAQGTWERWSPGGSINFTATQPALEWSFDLPPKSFIVIRFESEGRS